MTDATGTEWWRGVTLPVCIETKRVALRSFMQGDGRALKDAIDANLEPLQRWMPWATNEPSPLEAVEARVTKFGQDFATGPDWGYAIRLVGRPEIIGSCGMHARIGPNALEIGYWIDSRHTGRGYATEAAGALAAVALALPLIDRVEIRCDPENRASAAVPRRLGFRYVTTLEKNERTPSGDVCDTMVFELARDAHSTPTNGT